MRTPGAREPQKQFLREFQEISFGEKPVGERVRNLAMVSLNGFGREGRRGGFLIDVDFSSSRSPAHR